MEAVKRGRRSARAPALPWRIGILLCIAAAIGARVSAQSVPQISEYDVKAAFLLNFTKFVEWPPSAFADPASPLAICILGEDPFGENLEILVRGEVIDRRRLAVRRIKQAPPPKTCQVLFVSASEKDVPEITASVGPWVLTVGDREGSLRDGVIICFVVEERHVRFDINQRAAASAMLTLSARLLTVARSVQK
jgi:hypothetical protein